MTSEPNYTPGPWKYAGWDSVKCDVYQDSTAPHGRDKIAEVIREADAALIAAAPDLLEACSAWMDWMDGPGDGTDKTIEEEEAMRADMRAAIAKAVFRPTS